MKDFTTDKTMMEQTHEAHKLPLTDIAQMNNTAYEICDIKLELAEISKLLWLVQSTVNPDYDAVGKCFIDCGAVSAALGSIGTHLDRIVSDLDKMPETVYSGRSLGA